MAELKVNSSRGRLVRLARTATKIQGCFNSKPLILFIITKDINVAFVLVQNREKESEMILKETLNHKS